MLRLLLIVSVIVWFSTGGDAQSGIKKKSAVSKKPIWNATVADTLKNDLLITYDVYSRPTSNKMQINIKLKIHHIDIDDQLSTMNIFGKIVMTWTDEKLKWTSSEYNDIVQLNLDDSQLWIPDIIVMNSANQDRQKQFGKTNCIVKNDGTIIWSPQINFQTYCDLNLSKWPFDAHECKLLLGSLSFDKNEVDLNTIQLSMNNNNNEQDNDGDDEKGDEDDDSKSTNYNETNNGSDTMGIIDNELLVANHEWSINDVNVQRNEYIHTYYDKPYINIEYNVIIERRSQIYTSIVFTPASILILMILANFLLPPQFGEKILLNGICAFTIVIMLLYFTQKLSAMALHTPLVVLFYTISLHLVTVSMIISIIVIKLSREKHVYALPWFFKKLLDGTFGKCLLLRMCTGDEQISTLPEGVMVEELQEQQSSESQEATIQIQNNNDTIYNFNDLVGKRSIINCSIQQDWINLATAIDRIAFLCYCFIFIFLSSIYSV